MDNRDVDVVVETPKGDANVYEWDKQIRGLRLRGVRHAESKFPFELGHVAHTLTAHGEPLPALLLITFPTFEGCFVSARVLGAIERPSGESISQTIVAVASNDSCLTSVASRADFDHAASGWLESLRGDEGRWAEPLETEEIIDAARQRWKLSRATVAPRPRAPAWRAEDFSTKSPPNGNEAARHSLAESRLSTLPLRFQKYFGSLLSPAERILLWVYRPLLTRGGIGWFGREVLRQGLLVISDEQFLWIMDPTTPSLTVEGYGYIARTFALQRLERAEMITTAKYLNLQVTLKNERGDVESFGIEFPSEAREDLEEAVRLLNGFTPGTNPLQLARAGTLEPSRRELTDPMAGDMAATRIAIERLQRVLDDELVEEKIYAQAFVPAWDGGAKLLTVTDRYVRLTLDPPQRARLPLPIPLGMIGSVEMCSSPLGSWFRLWLPSNDKLGRWEMKFPPIFSDSFNDCAVALRQLLSLHTDSVIL